MQIWDTRTKDAVTFIHSDFPITAICLSEAGNELFTGGIDNDIKVWDLRRQAVTYCLLGHTDTVTSLQMSPDNQTLLSNAHDSTVRTWDVRPFAPADRRIRTYDGAPTGAERNLLKASWDSTGEKIAAGSGDQSVAIWETRTGKLLNKLPGHRGAVNDVRFHPRGEPIRKYPHRTQNSLPTVPLSIAIPHSDAVDMDADGKTLRSPRPAASELVNPSHHSHSAKTPC